MQGEANLKELQAVLQAQRSELHHKHQHLEVCHEASYLLESGFRASCVVADGAQNLFKECKGSCSLATQQLGS